MAPTNPQERAEAWLTAWREAVRRPGVCSTQVRYAALKAPLAANCHVEIGPPSVRTLHGVHTNFGRLEDAFLAPLAAAPGFDLLSFVLEKWSGNQGRYMVKLTAAGAEWYCSVLFNFEGGKVAFIEIVFQDPETANRIYSNSEGGF